MVTVKIQGHGDFVIPPDKLNELITWLTNNSITKLEGQENYHGKTLLNESETKKVSDTDMIREMEACGTQATYHDYHNIIDKD